MRSISPIATPSALITLFGTGVGLVCEQLEVAASDGERRAQLVGHIFEEMLLRVEGRLQAVQHAVDGGRHRTDLVTVLESRAQAEGIGRDLVRERGDRLQWPQPSARREPGAHDVIATPIAPASSVA